MNIFYLIHIFCNIALIDAAQSYPQFIGHGYNSCINCQYNPYGNGPLNDYGRSLSTTALSDSLLVNEDIFEEELASKSNFLYLDEIHKYVRPSLDRDVEKNDGDSEYINIQADQNLVYLVNENVFVSMSYGCAPKPRSIQDEDIETYRSREHYIGYRPNDTTGFYMG
jgi:hypothetical protein